MVRALLTPEEKKRYFFKFNVDGLLRGDYQSRMQGYATARQNGWMSANDIRELENLDKIPAEDGGDLYLVNGNMIPIVMAGQGGSGGADGGQEESAGDGFEKSGGDGSEESGGDGAEKSDAWQKGSGQPGKRNGSPGRQVKREGG